MWNTKEKQKTNLKKLKEHYASELDKDVCTLKSIVPGQYRDLIEKYNVEVAELMIDFYESKKDPVNRIKELSMIYKKPITTLNSKDIDKETICDPDVMCLILEYIVRRYIFRLDDSQKDAVRDIGDLIKKRAA